MSTHRARRVHVRVALPGLAVALGLAGISILAQAPAQPPDNAPQGSAPAQLPGGQGGGRRGAGAGGGQDNTGADFSPKPPMQPRTPQEEARSFLLPAGYRMELVAADPDINNPAVVEFDGNGRMYVAEFRSYMRDADATAEHEPTSRISRWESTKGDGVYDKHTVFVDKLVLPAHDPPARRQQHPDQRDALRRRHQVQRHQQRRRRRQARVFYTGVGVGRDGNLEHEQSGFIWGLDNWIYSTYNAFRFRWTPDGILREPTGAERRSWGLTQDDDGKMWFINAGGERGPVNFQLPIQYGAFTARRRVRAGIRDRVAGAGHRRHAGRHAAACGSRSAR